MGASGQHPTAAAVAAGQEPAAARSKAPPDAVASAFPESAQQELDALLAYMSLQSLHQWKAGVGPSFTVLGRVGAHEATILFDTGATGDFMSEAFAKRLGYSVTPRERAVTLADGRVMQASGATQGQLWIGAYREAWPLHVLPLHGADVVLGTEWLAKHDATLDVAGGSVTFTAPSGRMTVVAGTQADDTLVSALQLRLMCERDEVEELFLVFVRDGEEEEEEASPANTPAGPSPDLPFAEKASAHIEDLELRAKLKALLEEYESCFVMPEGLPSDHDGHVHRVKLKPGSIPPARPAYRMSVPEREECRRQLVDLLRRGYIRPSCSEYSAPVLFIRKKDGSLRMCIDYRALNQQTVKDQYPISRIDELIDLMRHSAVFSSLDMESGYWQMLMAPEDVHKTAFATPFGLFEWLVLPFGLTGAPASFSRLVSGKVFPALEQDQRNPFLTYLDDVCVHSRSDDEHLADLREALERVRANHVTLKPSKCKFLRREISFLGHVVSAEGIRCETDKVEAVRNWPTPACAAELRSFLGLAGFYRKFVPRFSHVAAPLTDLQKDGVPFFWGRGQAEAFDRLKRALTNAPVLRIADPDLPFVLHVDASGFALGGALMQDFGNGLQPVAFASRKFKDAETRYAPHDAEMLACVSCLQEWQHLLRGAKSVTVYSDHHSLQHFFTQPHLNQRQLRWKDFLDSLNPEIKYIKGTANVVADALSRNPVYLRTLLLAPIAHVVATAGDVTAAFQAGYAADPVVQQIRQDIAAGVPTPYAWENGYLYAQSGKLYVPDAPGLRQRLLREHHDIPIAGHLGRDKTLANLSEQFMWPGMSRDVAEYIRSCPACQQSKATNRAPGGLLHPLATPNVPFEQISTDLITALPASGGYNAVLTFVDRLTKAVHFVPTTKDVTAKQLAQLFFANIFRVHGLPKVIVSDRDPKFTSKFWTHLFGMVGTKLAMSTAFHPQTDGQTERAHRTLEDMLRSFVNDRQNNWVSLLPALEFAYNNSVQASTGYQPFFLLYGRKPYVPPKLIGEEDLPPTEGSPSLRAHSFLGELRRALAAAKANLAGAQRRQKEYADRSRRDVTFAAGDEVMLEAEHLNLPGAGPSSKLNGAWVGPFAIVEMVHPLAARLKLPDSLGFHPVVHVSRLKHFCNGEERFPGRTVALHPPPVTQIAGQDAWDVDCFVKERWTGRARKHQLLVRWAGWPGHDQWRDASDLKEDLGATYDELLAEMHRPAT